jgi:hypothetical protein
MNHLLMIHFFDLSPGVATHSQNMQHDETVAPQDEPPDPVFHKVGENLYWHVPSGNYYALLKRGGKQFRRSLKTFDRALAQRRLAALRDQVNSLTLTCGPLDLGNLQSAITVTLPDED